MGSQSPTHTARARSRARSAQALFTIWATALLGKAIWESPAVGARIVLRLIMRSTHYPFFAPSLVSTGGLNITMGNVRRVNDDSQLTLYSAATQNRVTAAYSGHPRANQVLTQSWLDFRLWRGSPIPTSALLRGVSGGGQGAPAGAGQGCL